MSRAGYQMPVNEAYGVLGLEPGAPAEDVKAAYRRLAMAHHPDRSPPALRPAAAETFQRITAAHARLLRSPHEDVRAAHTASYARSYTRAPPKPLSPAVFATLFAVPFALFGCRVYMSSQQEDMLSGRVNGIIEPPVNPWLKEELYHGRPYHKAWYHDKLRWLFGGE